MLKYIGVVGSVVWLHKHKPCS